MNIPAIQTRYADCDFRSRLEARWAVFFDHLGIRWEYEAQGYMVSYRLNLDDERRFNYLPDFWLPDFGLHAEVKGSLTDAECFRLVSAAASLSSNDGAGCHDSGGHDLVVLGPIPRPDAGRIPIRLHMHKGDLCAVRFHPEYGEVGCFRDGITDSGFNFLDAVQLITDVDERFDYSEVRPATASGVARFLLGGWDHYPYTISQRLSQAYAAARSARFEFGQSGARAC